MRRAPVVDHVERMTDDERLGDDAIPGQQPSRAVDLTRE